MRCIMHRCPSVESDDGMYRERAHSFSTERSDRTTVFADGVVGERARAIGSIDEEMEMENFPSARAIASLAGKVASMTDPDGAELHADVALGLLARERETHGTFVFDERRAHHAPYRAQLVEWILDVCAGERYGPTTADVAIAYTVRLNRSIIIQVVVVGLGEQGGGRATPTLGARGSRAERRSIGCRRTRKMSESVIRVVRRG